GDPERIVVAQLGAGVVGEHRLEAARECLVELPGLERLLALDVEDDARVVLRTRATTEADGRRLRRRRPGRRVGAASGELARGCVAAPNRHELPLAAAAAPGARRPFPERAVEVAHAEVAPTRDPETHGEHAGLGPGSADVGPVPIA